MWKDALKKRKTHVGRRGMTPKELKDAKEKLRRKENKKLSLKERIKRLDNHPTFRAKQERARRSVKDD